MPPPTILTHKSAFLTAQTLHLSQTLAPSRAWRVLNSSTHSEQVISEKAVDDALHRLNNTLQQHVSRVYAPQATRHVAEQIETLFLAGDGTAADEDGDAQTGTGLLTEGVDLTIDQAISALPPTWDAHRPSEAEARPLEARRYAELQSHLAELSALRAAAKARVERLRHMSKLLAPFQDRESLQNNLVTRNGELEKELERMRTLLVRVTGRVAQLPGERGGREDVAMAVQDLDEVERDKVRMLLDGL